MSFLFIIIYIHNFFLFNFIKDMNMQNELWNICKLRFWLYINKVKQFTITSNPRRTTISTRIVKNYLGSDEYTILLPLCLSQMLINWFKAN